MTFFGSGPSSEPTIGQSKLWPTKVSKVPQSTTATTTGSRGLRGNYYVVALTYPNCWASFLVQAEQAIWNLVRELGQV